MDIRLLPHMRLYASVYGKQEFIFSVFLNFKTKEREKEKKTTIKKANIVF